MKFLFVALTLLGTAYAALLSNEYLPPLEDVSPVNNFDLQSLSENTSPLADDGYRYKTVKRFRLRHRRDVNELPSNEYLPPVNEAPAVVDIPVAVEAPIEQDSAVLANDGYRYKTVKRLRYRHRRDVNELPSNEYLPPSEEVSVVAEAPVAVAQEVAQDSAVLANDGYRYKTVKRLRYRRRRDVNELPSNEYLPPSEEVSIVAEAPVAVAQEVAQDSAILANDGYRYKTVKRFRLRHRRDVNELPSNEYLPPSEEVSVVAEAPVAVAQEVAQDSAVLANDGYRYKTVKRLRYRRRRDVNELPSNEYLPPSEEVSILAEAPVAVAQEVAQDSAILANDGYRYKTVKRFRLRHRRDVNELPSNEYLPPSEEVSVVAEAPVAVAQEVAQDSAVLANDGYRYKTVKRLRYRRRRDVNELPSNEYLPPSEEVSILAEAPVAVAQEVAQDSAILANDGYRYKTVKRFRLRHRRDVNELPSNEYLPPSEEVSVVAEAPVAIAQEVAQDSAVLANDGYRYKTVKRLRYRRRRDVNELPSNEYLPPSEEISVVPEATVAVAQEVAQDSAFLANDGYRYKTVKRVVYKHRS